MNKRSVKPLSAGNSLNEIGLLKARIAELEKGNDEQIEKPIEHKDDKVIQQDDYIPVMSLLPYTLNLSTKESGQGNIKKFTKFGEVKRILYRDLVDILEVNTSFVDAGYFYILDPALIRRHGLDDVYSKILTKEKIEEILSASSENCITLYNSANEEQQRTIIGLFISKLKENPGGVNLNVIDKISRISGIDIVKRAEESKELELEMLKEEQ